MANANTNARKFKDQVVLNGILKEQVEKEELATKLWESKWGFMKDFNKVCIDVAASMGISESRYREMVTKRKSTEMNTENRFKPEIKPSDPVPLISSGFVGWRCKHRNSLEICGPLYVSPRHTIDPPGVEKYPRTQIMLG